MVVILSAVSQILLSEIRQNANFIQLKLGQIENRTLRKQDQISNFVGHKLTPLRRLQKIGSDMLFIFEKPDQISKVEKIGSNT